MAKITEAQQKKLAQMTMWSRDWVTALNIENPTAKDIEARDWYAHMALRDAEELGLDAERVLGRALVSCAEDHRNFLVELATK